MANNDLGNQLSVLTQMKDLLGNIPSAYDKATEAAGRQSQALQELAASMEEANDPSGIQDMTSAMEELAAETEKTSGAFGSFGKKAGMGAVVLGGLNKGFGVLKQGLAGAWSMLTSVTSSVWNLAKGAVGALMNSWGALVGMAYDVRASGDSARKAFEELKTTFGSLASNEGKAVVDSFKQLKGAGGFAAQTGMSLRYVFGGEFTAALKHIATIAGEMGQTFSLLRDEFAANATTLLVMNKGLGLSGEALGNLSLKAKLAGEDVGSALTETMQQITYLEKKYKVDGKLIGKNLDKLGKDVSTFGSLTQAEMTAAATYATKLGVSIESIGASFDKFGNFEDAATGAAHLAASFGMSVDAMELMNNAGTPAAIDQLRTAFNETGKSLEDMSTAERKYFEDLTGLKGDELFKAFDPANADISYDDMLADAEEAAENVSPEEAMLNAAEKIEKVMDRMAEKSKGFFDSFKKGFMKGVSHSEAFRKVMNLITTALDKVYHIGYNLAQALFGKGGVFGDSNSKGIQTFGKYLDKIVGLFQTFSDGIVLLAEGKITFKQFIKGMIDEVKSVFSSPEVFNFGKLLADMFAQGVAFLIGAIPGILSGLAYAFTSANETFFGSGSEAGNGVQEAMGGIFGDAIKTIKTAFIENKEEIKAAFSELMTAAAEFFENVSQTEGFQKIQQALGVALGGVLSAAMASAFGNMFTNMIVIKAIKFGLKKMKHFLFGKPAAETVAKGSEGFLSKAWKKISDVLKGWGTKVKKFFTFPKIMEKFSAGISKISGFFKNLIKPLTTVGGAMGNATSNFAAGSKTLTFLSGTMKKLIAPLGLIISAVKSIWRWFGDLKEIWTSSGSILSKLGDTIKSFFGRVIFFAMDFVKGFTDMIDFVVQGIFGFFNIEIPSLSDWLFGEGGPEAVFQDWMNFDWFYMFSGIGNAIMDGIITPIANFGILIGEIVSEAWNGVLEFFGIKSPSTVAAEAGTGILDGLMSTLADMPGLLADMAKNALGALNPLEWGGKALELGGALVDGLADGAKNIGSSILEGGKNLLSGLGSVFRLGSPSDATREMGQFLTDGLAEGSDGMGNALDTNAQAAVTQMINTVEGLDLSKLGESLKNIQDLGSLSEAVAVLQKSLDDMGNPKTKDGKKLVAVKEMLAAVLPEFLNLGNFIQNWSFQNAKVLASLKHNMAILNDELKVIKSPIDMLLKMMVTYGEASTTLPSAKKIKATGTALASALTAWVLEANKLDHVFFNNKEMINSAATNFPYYATRISTIDKMLANVGKSMQSVVDTTMDAPSSKKIRRSYGAMSKSINQMIKQFAKMHESIDLEKLSGTAANLDGLSDALMPIANALAYVEYLMNFMSTGATNTAKMVTDMASEIEVLGQTLGSLEQIDAIANVEKVAAGLAGDGTVMVKHEGVNITVNFKVNMDSKDLAAALGDDAEGGPFFVINTSRGGADAGGAESVGE